MRARTPIEAMVDKACGFDPNAEENTDVLLRCPVCKRTHPTPRQKQDPPGTAEIELTCPKCWTDGTYECPIYFDKHGKQIAP